jgi:hypothetical protein
VILMELWGKGEGFYTPSEKKEKTFSPRTARGTPSPGFPGCPLLEKNISRSVARGLLAKSQAALL